MRNDMNSLSLLLIFFMCSFDNPCRQVTITNNRHKRELKSYITQSQKEGFFKYNKGIILLTEHVDSLKQVNWIIDIKIEDDYKNRNISGWAKIKNKTVLFYNYDNLNNKALYTKTELSCLQQVVGNQVFQRSSNNKSIVGGGAGNSMHIIFHNNGRIVRLKGA